jgi:serine protease
MSIVSLGGGSAPIPVFEDAVRYAVSKGVFVVVCGGNNGDIGNDPNRLAQFLGQVNGAVAVGAVGRDLNRAFYSTRASYVELAAPGGNSRVGGTQGAVLQQTVDITMIDTFIFGPYRPPRADAFVYSYFQGTSMAAPHVAGFAALLMQQGIKDPAAIEAAMKQFATDRGSPGKDDEYGYGLINPRATLRGLGLSR